MEPFDSPFFQGATPGWYALAILLLPLGGFLFTAFTWKSGFTRKHGHVVPLATIGVALFCALSIFKHAVIDQQPAGAHAAAAEHGAKPGQEHGGGGKAAHEEPSADLGDHRPAWSSKEHGGVYALLSVGSLHIDAGITIDALTAAMLAVVCIVAFLVHLYSVGYMHGDKRFPRFFAFLQLFSFSMLGLVLTDNLLLLFCFWELVGVCSYFLIGFWFEQDEPPKASMKAFMTNRFGDVGFLLGILFAWGIFKTLDIHEIYGRLQHMVATHVETSLFGWGLGAALTVMGLLLFLGPMAKSAQVPLHVWLPDAMAGPTPVSALIHAATMVAAGVYMVGRVYFLFTPTVLGFIAVVGTITALVAATIGLVHNNIKKVLAYSTCSQLGYMMLSLGVGGYSAGLFHLYTHAFFKACLFLGAGSVIHAVHTEDMREMGGLRSKMPKTFATFVIATLALAGVPFFSGAFSKEMIVEHAIQWGMNGTLAHWLPAVVAVFGGGLTFFYMMRLLYLTFFGPPRDHHKFEHAHESPPTMTIPLFVLGSLAIVSVGWPVPFLGGHKIPELLAPPPALATVAAGQVPHHGEESFFLSFVVLVISVAVLVFAYRLYVRTYKQRSPGPEVWVRRFGPAYGWATHLYFFDELYQATVVRLGGAVSRAFTRFDVRVVDGAVNGVASIGLALSSLWGMFDRVVVDGTVNSFWHATHFLSRRFRRLQTGNAQDYLAFAVGGIALVSLLFVFLS
jgi:NADH-quinone oxidoreductase subunit L